MELILIICSSFEVEFYFIISINKNKQHSNSIKKNNFNILISLRVILNHNYDLFRVKYI